MIAPKFTLRAVLTLTPEEASFARRGFRGAAGQMRARLESAGGTFVQGYNLALEHGTAAGVEGSLKAIPNELRGFAFEGAAMGLALLDWLTPWRRNRVNEFLGGDGGAHTYMVHVGVGWVWAKLPVNFRRAKLRLDPLLGWLAFDGWGFHEGFFHWPKYMEGQAQPRCLRGYERRVFDQGLGRSFWFVNGGNVELIARAISGFASERRADLWSGIGLAATYAGMAAKGSLVSLREAAGVYSAHLAQGAAFAAKARQRAGNVTDYTSLATQVLCGMEATTAARLTDATLECLPGDGDEPAYEVWRRRIQNHWQRVGQLQNA